MIPGELLPLDGEHPLNTGRRTTTVVVCNPTPSQIQSQHDALTMLFTKG